MRTHTNYVIFEIYLNNKIMIYALFNYAVYLNLNILVIFNIYIYIICIQYI